MLWLATTLVEPPEESIHVTWRKCGLATYLLSILVKQHTGIGDGSLENSIISMQASMDRQNPVRRFYLNLGLHVTTSLTMDFQRQVYHSKGNVKDFPELWIPADSREDVSVQVATRSSSYSSVHS